MSTLKGLSAALENLQQTQKMKLLNHQRTTAAADDNSVSVVVRVILNLQFILNLNFIHALSYTLSR